MEVVYQGARNPSACKKRHKILCAKGARNPAQAGKKIASPKAINYIKHSNNNVGNNAGNIDVVCVFAPKRKENHHHRSK